MGACECKSSDHVNVAMGINSRTHGERLRNVVALHPSAQHGAALGETVSQRFGTEFCKSYVSQCLVSIGLEIDPDGAIGQVSLIERYVLVNFTFNFLGDTNGGDDGCGGHAEWCIQFARRRGKETSNPYIDLQVVHGVAERFDRWKGKVGALTTLPLR